MARKPKRSFDVHRFWTTEENKCLEVSVAYCEGGANLFNGGTSDRGYYLHVTPIKVEMFEGREIKSFMLFHGCKSKIEDAKRFSDKRLSALIEQARQDCENRADKIMRLVNFVLAEEHASLAETAEVA